MTKPENLKAYPAHSLATSEAALLTVWPALAPFHDELVLIGGLAVHHLTLRTETTRPATVTMDVDFGIALGAGGEGLISIQGCLSDAGFKEITEKKTRRMQKIVGKFPMYVDFITEDPPKQRGGTMVDNVVADIATGIDRALAAKHFKRMEGLDIFGEKRSCTVAIADIGPMLVLKLNAFLGEEVRRGKDAYDILLLVTAHENGPAAAIEAFHAEAATGNTGYNSALAVLRQDFLSSNAEGPTRAAEFSGLSEEERLRVQEDLVTVARLLLGE